MRLGGESSERAQKDSESAKLMKRTPDERSKTIRKDLTNSIPIHLQTITESPMMEEKKRSTASALDLLTHFSRHKAIIDVQATVVIPAINKSS
jgi:hypothetical protein